MTGKTEFSTDFEKNKKRIDELLKVDQSFDFIVQGGDDRWQKGLFLFY